MASEMKNNNEGETLEREDSNSTTNLMPTSQAPKYPIWTRARKIAKKRYNNHLRKITKKGITEQPTFGEWLTVLRTNIFGNDFRCYYCGNKLELNPQYTSTRRIDYKNVFSFDHKIPLSRGGSVKKDNLCICCCRCNIIKGTLKAETYIKLLNKLKDDEPLMNEILENWWETRIVNKIEREKKEEKYDNTQGIAET